MGNTSWTRICLHSRLLELSRASILAVSCHSVSIRGSKSACIFSLPEKRTDTRTSLQYPAHAARHGETRLPTRWEGKGLLGAVGWDTSRREGSSPFALACDAISACAEPGTLGHPMGSQLVSTKGLRAALPPNRPPPLEKRWDDAGSLAMKLWGFFQQHNGFRSRWQSCEEGGRSRNHQARPTQSQLEASSHCRG